MTIDNRCKSNPVNIKKRKAGKTSLFCTIPMFYYTFFATEYSLTTAISYFPAAIAACAAASLAIGTLKGEHDT